MSGLVSLRALRWLTPSRPPREPLPTIDYFETQKLTIKRCHYIKTADIYQPFLHSDIDYNCLFLWAGLEQNPVSISINKTLQEGFGSFRQFTVLFKNGTGVTDIGFWLLHAWNIQKYQ